MSDSILLKAADGTAAILALAGAEPVSSRELIARLHAAGLRRRKRMT